MTVTHARHTTTLQLAHSSRVAPGVHMRVQISHLVLRCHAPSFQRCAFMFEPFREAMAASSFSSHSCRSRSCSAAADSFRATGWSALNCRSSRSCARSAQLCSYLPAHPSALNVPRAADSDPLTVKVVVSWASPGMS